MRAYACNQALQRLDAAHNALSANVEKCINRRRPGCRDYYLFKLIYQVIDLNLTLLAALFPFNIEFEPNKHDKTAVVR